MIQKILHSWPQSQFEILSIDQAANWQPYLRTFLSAIKKVCSRLLFQIQRIFLKQNLNLNQKKTMVWFSFWKFVFIFWKYVWSFKQICIVTYTHSINSNVPVQKILVYITCLNGEWDIHRIYGHMINKECSCICELKRT